MTPGWYEPYLRGMSESFRDLIDRFGIGEFAAAIGVTYGAAKQMRRRDSVGPEYWPSIIDASRARGWDDVSADTLLSLVHASAAREVATKPAEAGA